MRFAGILPEDAPDPRWETIARLRRMPVPLLGLAPQPHVEDWGGFGVQASESNGVVEQMAGSLSYTLWRNPGDRADPANLAELDDDTRAALDMSPPWPRPRWLLDAAERMRYPMLWEAVRTTWNRPGGGGHRNSLEQELVWHVNHVLMNRFSPPGQHAVPSWERTEGLVDERHVEHAVPVTIDGESVPGVRIDTDPNVLAIGANLGPSGVLTAVIEREHLPFVTLEFARRSLDG